MQIVRLKLSDTAFLSLKLRNYHIAYVGACNTADGECEPIRLRRVGMLFPQRHRVRVQVPQCGLRKDHFFESCSCSVQSSLTNLQNTNTASKEV